MKPSIPTPMSRVCRVLVMDENPLCRLGLSRWLEHESGFSLLAAFGFTEELLGKLETGEVDLVIVDIAVQSGAGFELIGKINHRHPGVRILVFSSLPEEIFAQRAIQAGAAGFVSKRCELATLRLAMNSVFSGETYFSADVSARFTAKYLGQGGSVSASSVEALSNRELQVFRLIGEGRSTRAVAESLHLSAKTVETYIEHLKRKLALDSRVALAHRAIQWREQEFENSR